MRALIDVPITELLPHRGAMCWLDRAIAGDAENLQTAVTIRPEHLLYDGNGVGGWAGIELMAQSVAAWAGWRARLKGSEPRLGFLLGCRSYQCSKARFLPGEQLTIEVHCEFLADNGLGKFDCRIILADEVVASAALTVFEPSDASAYLRAEDV